jgi:hypothetical protein
MIPILAFVESSIVFFKAFASLNLGNISTFYILPSLRPKSTILYNVQANRLPADPSAEAKRRRKR